MSRAQKIIVAVATALLVGTWLWPAWYEYSAVALGKWSWAGHHFALTFRSAEDNPVKIDWGRLILFDLIVIGLAAAMSALVARRKNFRPKLHGRN